MTGIFLRSNSDKQIITLSTHDLNQGLSIDLIAKTDTTIDLLLPGKIFIDATTLGDDDVTTLKLDDQQFTFQNHQDQASFSILDVNSYPQPQITNTGLNFELPASLISSLKTKSLFAVSTDLTRPQLTGVYFNFLSSNLEIVTTDGFRLSILDFPLPDGIDSEFSFIIPASTISLLDAILEKNQISSFRVIFNPDLQQIVFQAENFTFWVNTIKLAFPPYEKIIPPDFVHEVKLNRDDFYHTLQKTALFAKENANTAQIIFNSKQITIKTQSETGIFESQLPTNDTCPQDFNIAFNIKYLTDYLNTINDEEIILGLNDAVKPVMFYQNHSTSSNNNHYKYRYIVMPFKIRT